MGHGALPYFSELQFHKFSEFYKFGFRPHFLTLGNNGASFNDSQQHKTLEISKKIAQYFS